MRKQYAIRQSLFLGIGIGVVLALVFIGGYLSHDLLNLSRTSSAQASSGNYALLDEVQGLIDRHFLREQPPPSVREYAAIRGMLASLNDRFTFFIDPPVAASESDALAGTYGGIGVQARRNAQGQVELFPYDDSPAAKAGIANSDILTAVNGTAIDATMTQDQIDQMLRGEVKEGSGAQLTVTQAATGKDVTIFVPFAVINVPSVTWHVVAEDPSLGYVQVSLFTGRTPDELKAALGELKARNVQGLILDLRGNTGGLLQESVQVANAFVGSGPLVFEDDKQGETIFNAQANAVLTALPLAVLVNDHTASGAELVAGAIQDAKRGVLIGQKTYGKGTVQEIFPLSDGSSLHVTSAAWLTPDHRALDTVGLQPDIPVEVDAQGRDLELAAAVGYLEPKVQTEATPEASPEQTAAAA